MGDLPQSPRGQAPALNRQGGNVRVAAPYNVEFILQNEYVSYKCRSGRASVRSRRSAGRGSSSSRSRLAKSYGRFAPLDLRQDCFFRVSLAKQHYSYSPPAADNLIPSTHPFTVKLRSDSFQKLRMLRNRLDLISSLHSADYRF